MPDAVASFSHDGETFLVTANEGDARDWPGYSDELRVNNEDYVLDPAVFPNAGTLKANANLGRLNVSTASGNLDDDSEFERIDVFGTRSMTIWTADGQRIWDSGDQIEQAVAAALPARFNSTNDANTFDDRSDNKGPEPEGVAVGVVDGRRLAFVGLERVGGLVVFDLTDPMSPAFVEYVTSRDFSADPTDGSTDSGPEVVTFVSAAESPSGRPLVLVSNEWSGSVAIFSPGS
jgi:hypothetical protein